MSTFIFVVLFSIHNSTIDPRSKVKQPFDDPDCWPLYDCRTDGLSDCVSYLHLLGFLKIHRGEKKTKETIRVHVYKNRP